MFIDPVHIAPLVHMAAFIVGPETSVLKNIPCIQWCYTLPKIYVLGPLLHNPSVFQQSNSAQIKAIFTSVSPWL